MNRYFFDYTRAVKWKAARFTQIGTDPDRWPAGNPQTVSIVVIHTSDLKSRLPLSGSITSPKEFEMALAERLQGDCYFLYISGGGHPWNKLNEWPTEKPINDNHDKRWVYHEGFDERDDDFIKSVVLLADHFETFLVME